MPRACTVCDHPDSLEINEAIVGVGEQGKLSNRAITRQYGLSKDAVRRHIAHIPQLLVKASMAQEIADADLLLDDIAAIREKTFDALDKAEEADDIINMLRAIREARENVRILGELRGLLSARVETRPLISPVAMNVIVQVLAPHPELATTLAEALEPLEELEAASSRS